MWTLSCNLSTSSLQEIKKQLKNISIDVERANLICIEKMVEFGTQRAKQILMSKIGQTGYKPTGRLEESISGESSIESVNVALGRIYSDLEYASFVEFGTGVRGSSSNEATMAGLDSAEVNVNHDTTWLGQYAKNFMWETRIELERMYPKFMEEAIKEVGG